MARLAVLLFCVILAACAPVTAPAGLENSVPEVTGSAFITHDGVRLPLRRWEAAKPRAVMVALHGMNDYSNAFAMPAEAWVKDGISTYAYDQRGFGGAPSAGLWPGAGVMRRDLSDCLEAVRAGHPGVPLFVLGESMGGAVVLTALASETPLQADGVILVAPAVWSRADMPFYYSTALWLTAHTMPWLTVTGKGLKIWPSDNIEMLKKFSRDPMVIKATRTDAVWGLVNLMDDARQAAGRLKNPPPVLMLYGEKDQVIPRAPTEAVVKALSGKVDPGFPSESAATKAFKDSPSGQFEIHVYPKGYHMLLRDLNGPEVWKDVINWIGERITAAPSPR